ncbi:hypothetical protein Hanom_Chr17g01571191 [Helianthus anomalus]
MMMLSDAFCLNLIQIQVFRLVFSFVSRKAVLKLFLDRIKSRVTYFHLSLLIFELNCSRFSYWV